MEEYGKKGKRKHTLMFSNFSYTPGHINPAQLSFSVCVSTRIVISPLLLVHIAMVTCRV